MIRWVHETKAQPVTDRNRFDRSLGQLVTDRYQFQSVTNWIQLICAIRQFSLWLIALALLAACQTAPPPKEAANRQIYTADYDLIIPAEQDLSRPGGKALLILFPCFSCDAADTRAESRIADTAAANGIAVLMMNFNRHIIMS